MDWDKVGRGSRGGGGGGAIKDAEGDTVMTRGH